MINLYNSSQYSEVQENASHIKDGYMFFSYHEQQNYGDNVFSLEIDSNDIISASQLFYHDDSDKLDSVLEDIELFYGFDKELAEELIGEEISVFDQAEWERLGIEDGMQALELDWAMQSFKADAAKILGYNAVAVQDENVESVMINVAEYKERIIKM